MKPARGLSSTLYSDPHPTAYLAAFAAVMATAVAEGGDGRARPARPQIRPTQNPRIDRPGTAARI